MATLDDLVTILSAETSGFKKQIDDAVRTVDQGNAKMTASVAKLDGLFTKAGASLKRAFTVAAIAGAATALVRMEDSLEVNAAHLKDMALQANVSYEALQRLRFAADQNGSSADEMDVALAKLNKSIGEAAGGSQQLSRVFHALGLENLIKQGAGTETVFYALAEALKQVPNPAERSAIVLALMGKSAGTLVDMMSQGASAIHSYTAALPQAAVLTDRVVDGLDASHDRTTELEKVLQGFGSSIAGGLLDAINGLGDLYDRINDVYHITDTLTAGWEEFARVVGGGIDAAVTAVAGPAKAAPFKTPEQALAQFLPEASSVGVKTKPRLGVRSTEVGSLFGPEGGDPAQNKIDSVIRNLQIERDAFNQSAEATKLDTELKRANVDISSKAGQKIAELVHQITQEEQARQNAADETSLYNEVMAEGNEVTDQMKTSTERAADEIERLNDLLSQGAITGETFQRAVDKATGATDAMQQFGESFADATSSVAVGLESWDTALKSLLQNLAKAILQAAILKAFGLESGGGAGGGIVDAIFGRATGGGVSAGMPYLVGEKGRPEIFMPDSPGRIIDARSARGADGIAVVQHFHGGLTAADLRQQIVIAKREMEKSVGPIMVDLQRRRKLSGAFA
jgi:hypothetical protein